MKKLDIKQSFIHLLGNEQERSHMKKFRLLPVGILFFVISLFPICTYANSHAIKSVSPVVYGTEGFYVDIDPYYLRKYPQLWLMIDHTAQEGEPYFVPVTSERTFVPLQGYMLPGYPVEVLLRSSTDYPVTYIDVVYPYMTGIYDIVWHSTVFENSRSIKVKLNSAKKGATLRVKIGKKVYKKKLKNKNKKTISIKIGHHTYGSEVEIGLIYKGNDIAADTCGMFLPEDYYYYEDWDENDEWVSDEYDKVYYARNIRRGMTKKQVRNTWFWGPPDDTASASGGWSYWYYDDGSSISFKSGRVNSWYNAAG